MATFLTTLSQLPPPADRSRSLWESILKPRIDLMAFVAALLLAVSLSGLPHLFAILSFIVLPIGMMFSALTSSQVANRLDASTNNILNFLFRLFLYSALTSVVVFVAILVTPSEISNWIGNSNERWITFIVFVFLLLRGIVVWLPAVCRRCKKNQRMLN
ncbi:MAG: hypothetical protein ACK5N9_00725 [Pirellula sp.]